jgi:hypothetical protein
VVQGVGVFFVCAAKTQNIKININFFFSFPYSIHTKLDLAIEFGAGQPMERFCTNQCIVYGINLISDCQFKQYTQSWSVSMFGDCHIWQTLLKFPLLIYNGVPIKISIKKHKLLLRIYFIPIFVFFTFSSNKLLMMFSLQIQILRDFSFDLVNVWKLVVRSQSLFYYYIMIRERLRASSW